MERRFGALVVDVVVIVAPLALFDYLILVPERPKLLLIIWLTISNLAGSLYHILLQGMYGQTVGKMLFRVKVVRYDDETPITMYHAFLRESPTVLFNAIIFGDQVTSLLSGAVIDRTEPSPLLMVVVIAAFPWILAEIICALKTRKRRAVHDLIGGTVVIRTDLDPVGSD